MCARLCCEQLIICNSSIVSSRLARGEPIQRHAVVRPCTSSVALLVSFSRPNAEFPYRGSTAVMAVRRIWRTTHALNAKSGKSFGHQYRQNSLGRCYGVLDAFDTSLLAGSPDTATSFFELKPAKLMELHPNVRVPKVAGARPRGLYRPRAAGGAAHDVNGGGALRAVCRAGRTAGRR